MRRPCWAVKRPGSRAAYRAEAGPCRRLGEVQRGQPGGLARVIDRPCFPDDGHFDLTRILETLFDLLGDVSREATRGEIVDVGWRDEDADLAPRLDGKRFLDALKRVGDAFQRFQPFDVGFD